MLIDTQPERDSSNIVSREPTGQTRLVNGSCQHAFIVTREVGEFGERKTAVEWWMDPKEQTGTWVEVPYRTREEILPEAVRILDSSARLDGLREVAEVLGITIEEATLMRWQQGQKRQAEFVDIPI